MLNYLTLIFGCQLAGEAAIRALDLPIPGPVVGMVVLFLLLSCLGSIPEDLGKVADTLLNHLSLLFVPAGVGVMLHFPLLGDDLLAITTALIISTALTIAVTALIMNRLMRGTLEQNNAEKAGEPK